MGMDLETYIHLSERVSLLEVSKCFPLYLHISKLKPKLQKCHTITVKFIAITAIAMFKDKTMPLKSFWTLRFDCRLDFSLLPHKY